MIQGGAAISRAKTKLNCLLKYAYVTRRINLDPISVVITIDNGASVENERAGEEKPPPIALCGPLLKILPTDFSMGINSRFHNVHEICCKKELPADNRTHKTNSRAPGQLVCPIFGSYGLIQPEKVNQPSCEKFGNKSEMLTGFFPVMLCWTFITWLTWSVPGRNSHALMRS